MERRDFLTRITGFICAPAIVRASSLMKLSPVRVEDLARARRIQAEEESLANAYRNALGMIGTMRKSDYEFKTQLQNIYDECSQAYRYLLGLTPVADGSPAIVRSSSLGPAISTGMKYKTFV